MSLLKEFFYADSNFRTDMFYDQDNSTACPCNGQYDQLYANGKTVCLNKDSYKYSVVFTMS